LSSGPKHKSLALHEITELSRKYGIRIFVFGAISLSRSGGRARRAVRRRESSSKRG
jgi:hypothetical protein